jgi:hypothetical protein
MPANFFRVFLLISSVLLAVSDEFSKVLGQTDYRLQTASNYFSFLFSSAVFKTETLDMACIDNKTDYAEYMVTVPECNQNPIHLQLTLITFKTEPFPK